MESMQVYLDKFYEVLASYAPNFVAAILMLVIGFWAISKIMKFVKQAMVKSSISQDVMPFINSLLSTTLKVLLLIMVAGKLGVEMASIIAAFAALFFGVGMALQGSLGHVAAGVLILWFRPYKIGDYIKVGEYEGFVEEIQIINTIIRGLDNQMMVIPNGKAIDDVLVNSTGEDGYIRAEFEINMPYNQNFEDIKKVINEALVNTENVLADPVPFIGIETFDSHYIVLTVRPYCNVKDYEQVFFDSTQNVKAALGKHGMKMAYSEAVEFGEISA